MGEKGKGKELPLEEAMKQLEDVVERLESGDVPLEESIRLFEEGMRISRLCGEKLDRMEQQVEILVQENGDWVKKPFRPGEDGE